MKPIRDPYSTSKYTRPRVNIRNGCFLNGNDDTRSNDRCGSDQNDPTDFISFRIVLIEIEQENKGV